MMMMIKSFMPYISEHPDIMDIIMPQVRSKCNETSES
jgi:hypothetical protein